MKVAVIGAGWAGMAAAVSATTQGHHATVFETARTLGGRARALAATLPDGRSVQLDNGQHILIGAYTQALALMEHVGVNTQAALLRLPLCLQYPDGSGLSLPDWPAPWDALAGICTNTHWTWMDKWSLLRTSVRWQIQGFQCDAQLDVQTLCKGLSPQVMQTLIEPLCVSALNTPPQRASAQVFLRVLKDSLFGVRGGSNLMLPMTDLSALFPVAAAHWLQHHGTTIHAGHRVTSLEPAASDSWTVNREPFDAVILATSSSAAATLVSQAAATCNANEAQQMQQMRQWAACASALQFEEIATVYAYAPNARLPLPMLTLHSTRQQPAQFVFDRGQFGGPAGLLAFVVSANTDDRDTVQTHVLQQGADQLARFTGNTPMTAIQTIVEKRATFACTPGLQRPAMAVAPGLFAAGDYIEGPYPATLEGAVRSGQAAAKALA